MVAGKKIVLIALAFTFFALLTTLFFFQDLFQKTYARMNKLSAGDQCSDEATASQPKVNPNKMLFVSCGGFLE